MLFFQFPSILPTLTQAASTTAMEVDDDRLEDRKATSAKKASTRPTDTKNDTSPSGGIDKDVEGLIGKMIVYKSGIVKLKIGELLYDVKIYKSCVRKPNIFQIKGNPIVYT